MGSFTSGTGAATYREWTHKVERFFGRKKVKFMRTRLEKADQEYDWFLVRIKVDPMMDSLRDDSTTRDTRIC